MSPIGQMQPSRSQQTTKMIYGLLMMILLILDHYKIIDKVEILDKNKMEVMYLKIEN
jgi:hypothetical protein